MGGPLRGTINCDMGEAYSLYHMGDDEALMPLVDLANVACGFHAGDFSVMSDTVRLAKAHGVKVGSHPSLPGKLLNMVGHRIAELTETIISDKQGFGRREMKVTPEEVRAMMLYQTGALCAFLKSEDMSLSHIKPHGSLYGMTSRDRKLADAAMTVCKDYGVPFIGLAGTEHQAAAEAAGVRFIAEWFADLEYNESGELLITKKHEPITVGEVKQRVAKVLTEGLVTTVSGVRHLGVGLSEVTICCHSDTPGAVEVARAVREVVEDLNAM